SPLPVMLSRGRRSVYCGADCLISAGRSVWHGVGDLLRISRWRLAETCCKTLVIRRLAQPDGKRPGEAVPSLQELASVCPTSARNALPLICVGHIDMRAQAEVRSARRSGTPE